MDIMKQIFKRQNTIAIIESPFQILQLYEYRKKYKCQLEIITRLNGRTQNDQQLINTLDYLKLSAHIYRLNSLSTIFIWNIFFIIKSMRYSHLVIGDDNSFTFRLLKFFFKKKNIIILDDGVSTIHSVTWNKCKRFTMFDIDGNNIQTHKFQNLSKIVSSGLGESTLIIGSDMLETNWVTTDYYYSLIERIIYHAQDRKNIIYIPHRNEKKSNVEKLCNYFKISYHNLNLPIELIGWELKHCPKHVYNVFSTGLFSLILLYPKSNFYQVKINLDEFKRNRDQVNKVYIQMLKMNVKGI